MSVMPEESRPDNADAAGAAGQDATHEKPVVVRRNAGLAALIGAAASAIAIGYLWRASQSGALVDWLLCAVMAAIGTTYLATLVDSRTPLLVADDLGVRIRLGSQWRGLPWEALGQVLVTPRRGLLHDGRLLFAPRSPERAMTGLDARGRWHARLNAKAYGAPLAVPLGLSTRLTSTGTVHENLLALAEGRTEVVQTGPQARASERAEAPKPAAGKPKTAERTDAPRRTLVGTLGTIVSRAAKRPDADRAATPQPALPPGPALRGPALPGPALPLRPTRPASRAEVTRDVPATFGNAALHLDPAEDETGAGLRERSALRRPGSVDLVFEPPEHGTVRPIARAGDAVEPLVIDEFVVEPAYDPVIGPELAAARTRLGMSVDDLAERTRIRPHVLEAIEVDDFAPCGGDFYARGHLRTLARVLGKDSEPLLAAFEDRYATAPLDARRVFEAELATGMTGSMRRTAGGPNWGLLAGVVLALVLVWGVVRLFAGTPQEHLVPSPQLRPAPAANAYPHSHAPAVVTQPVRVTLVATQDTGTLVVRNGDGRIEFTGSLTPGQHRRVSVVPPVRVHAADGGAVRVVVNGHHAGVLGPAGHPANRTFAR